MIRLQARAAAPVDLDRCKIAARASHLKFLPKSRRAAAGCIVFTEVELDL